ncbi:hypothetical protein SAMN04487968_11387 [Nocardioides terrae]|uniref:RibD C-terminal domain-containing protein n=1 Tax=Nocardioides terrae TaxID=574651 RepID=A0A1I1MUK1_9ACTN|nr:hypothetical protein [Nocardioides terrae]SFC89051.1 hypothetical protein SAMN04487968_11387 [Nocardioides terrae]
MSTFFSALATSADGYITGRTTYDDCEGFGGGSPHPTAPMVVVSGAGVTHLHYRVEK